MWPDGGFRSGLARAGADGADPSVLSTAVSLAAVSGAEPVYGRGWLGHGAESVGTRWYCPRLVISRIRSFLFFWIVVPLIATAGIFFGLRDGSAAWKAHNGEGVQGNFVATSARCKVTGNSCSTIYGDFTSTDGSVVKRHMVLYDAPKELNDGGEAAAIDSGAPEGVFVADGGNSYLIYTGFGAAGVVGWIVWILLVVRKIRRRSASPVTAPGTPTTV